MEIDKYLEDIRKTTLKILYDKIELGDLESIRIYLSQMDILGDSLYEKCIKALHEEVMNESDKSIIASNIFTNYVRSTIL